MYALCSDAMLKAITRRATIVDKKVQALNSEKRATAVAASGPAVISTAYFFDHLATKEDTEVVVEEEDFMEAMHELVPSVSVKELEHYDSVRRSFETVESTKKEREEVARRAPPPKVNGISNGKGKAKAIPAAPLPNDDDFILRTAGLSLTDNNGGHDSGDDYVPAISKGKGKGKGKMKQSITDEPPEEGFGNAVDGDDEALYA